jgi:hypothetical protein
MIEIRWSFPDSDSAIAALSKLGSAAHNANVERSPTSEDVPTPAEKPARKPRNVKTVTPNGISIAPATQTAAAPSTPGETYTGPVLLGAAAPDAPHAPVVNAAVDLFASNVPLVTAPVEQKQPEQKDLIAALRAAYDKSADKAIAIVAHFGVKAVGQIPKDKWAEAIAMAQKAVAA